MRFVNRWDNSWTIDHVLAMELYPWHSPGCGIGRVVEGGVDTLADLAREFIFEPIAEVKVDYAFSFTNQWLDVAESLLSRGLLRRLHFEELEPSGRVTPTVSVFELGGQQLVATKNIRGRPLAGEDFGRLQKILDQLR